MINKRDCWWYDQPWLYYSDSGVKPYDDTKIKIIINNSFWNYKECIKNSFGPCVKSSYFPFIYKNKELILYMNKYNLRG